MIKAIIFDLGDVVFDFRKCHVPSLSEWISTTFNTDLTVSTRLWEIDRDELFTGKITPLDFVKNLIVRTSSSKNPESVLKDWIESHKNDEQCIDWDVIEYIKTLKNKYKVYIFSNTFDVGMLSVMDADTKGIFDGIFTSDKIGFRKPDRKAFEYVINAVGFKPSECVLVDDMARNVIAAREYGLQAIEYESLTKLKSEMKMLLT